MKRPIFTILLILLSVFAFSQRTSTIVQRELKFCFAEMDKQTNEKQKEEIIKNSFETFVSQTHCVGFIIKLDSIFDYCPEITNYLRKRNIDEYQFICYVYYKYLHGQQIKIRKEVREYIQNTYSFTAWDGEYNNIDSALLHADQIDFIHYYNSNNNKLPKEILHFKNLEYLSISDCPELNWKRTFRMIKHFPKLKELDLCHNEVKKYPDKLGSLTQLTTLTIQIDSLIELPQTIKKLINLHAFSIHGCPYINESVLINQLVDLDSLRQLDLWNGAKTIPNEIIKLQQIEYLSLMYDLTEIPQVVKELSNLKFLDLVENHLSKINLKKGELNNLHTLDLSYNEFVEFPLELLFIDSLKYLYLNGNEIEKLPDDISKFKKIKRLELMGNNIEKLPENFSKLYELVSLNLQNTNLSDSAFFILEKMKQLKYLSIGQNNITSIPDSIFLMENLECLSLKKNNILYIPESLSKLKKLKGLDLDDCKNLNFDNVCKALKNMNLEILIYDKEINEEQKQILKELLPQTEIIYR